MELNDIKEIIGNLTETVNLLYDIDMELDYDSISNVAMSIGNDLCILNCKIDSCANNYVGFSNLKMYNKELNYISKKLFDCMSLAFENDKYKSYDELNSKDENSPINLLIKVLNITNTRLPILKSHIEEELNLYIKNYIYNIFSYR